MGDTEKVWIVGIAVVDSNGNEIGHVHYRYIDDPESDACMAETDELKTRLWEPGEIREGLRSKDARELEAARRADWALDALVNLDERFLETTHKRVLRP